MGACFMAWHDKEGVDIRGALKLESKANSGSSWSEPGGLEVRFADVAHGPHMPLQMFSRATTTLMPPPHLTLGRRILG